MTDEHLSGLRARIDEELSKSGPSPEDIKEVYARFGLAYYHAEVLHSGLCLFYSLSQIPAGGPVTAPRIEEHLRNAFDSTLGQILAQLKTILSSSLLSRLRLALERRNFIAHHFWLQRIALMGSIQGIAKLVAELSQDTELFCEMDVEVQKLSDPLHARLGLTADILTNALKDVVDGKDEPLNQQRKPRKEETIVNVFNAPTAPGMSHLVFQTEDSVLWQLCDAGLGWTAYDKPDPCWLQATNFAGLLPAKINPRPKASSPWTFEIPFGSKAVLSVRPGKLSGQVSYNLRPKKNAAPP